MKTIVRDGQSALDVAIQELGDVAGVFALAEQNGISITDELPAGTVLEVDRGDIVNQIVVSQQVIPATAIRKEDTIVSDGIEFWGIEYDFKVEEDGTDNQ